MQIIVYVCLYVYYPVIVINESTAERMIGVPTSELLQMSWMHLTELL